MGIFWWLLSRALGLFSLALVWPLFLALSLGEAEARGFFSALILSLFLSFVAGHLASTRRGEVRLLEGTMLAVVLFPVLSFLGSLPFFFAGLLDFPTALLEAASALTTTCLPAALLSPDVFPRSLFFWHALLSALGGFFYLSLLMSVLVQVSGCFGVTLSARQGISFAQVLGRMLRFIRRGAALYLALLAASLIAFFLAGLSPFQAAIASMLLVSTGGGAGAVPFYTPTVLLAALFSMLLGSFSLLLFSQALSKKSLSLVASDTELRALFVFWLGFGVLLTLVQGGDSVWQGLFLSLSFLSTTGLYYGAPLHDAGAFLLLVLAFVGGSMGAPGGGLKVVRLLVLLRLVNAEMKTVLHPRLVPVIKIDGRPVAEKVVGRILSFFFLYMLTFALFALLFALELGAGEAAALSAAALTGTGGLCEVFGVETAALSAPLKFALSLQMVLGRVEIFSFVLLGGFFLKSLSEKW